MSYQQFAKEKLEKDGEFPFNSQTLQIDDFVTVIAESMMEHLKKEDIFPVTNIQVNKIQEKNFKENSIQKSCNDEFFSGFATSEHLVKLLQDASHEKYFRVHTDEDTAKYTYLQTAKFQILYILYLQKTEGKGTQKGFFEYIDNFLNVETTKDTHRSQVALNTGLRFSFSILKEIHQFSASILENSLKYLYQALSDAPAGSIYGNDVFAFQQDTSLDEARDFLVSLIKERSKHSKQLIDLCVKIIVRLGIVRSNPEDILITVNLLNTDQTLSDEVDLRNEIKALPLKGSATTTTSAGTDKEKAKVSIKETRGVLRQPMVCVLPKDCVYPTEENLHDWTTDGQSIFLFQEDGLQTYTLPKERSDTIFIRDSNPKQDPTINCPSSMCYLKGKIYLRNSEVEDTPIFVFNPKTLCQDKEATEAIKFSEDENSITMKKTKDAHKETGRLVGNSQIFTDGTYLYIVTQKKHVKPADASEDDPVVPTAIVIEQYCPTDFKHLKSTTLLKNDHGEIFVQKKVGDAEKLILSSTFHTNGNYLLVCNGKSRHLFDMNTGVRIEKQKDDTFCAVVFHDHENSKFYTLAFDSEDTKKPFLTDFKIDALAVQKKSLTTTESSQNSFATPIEKIRAAYLQGHQSAPVSNVIQRKMIKQKTPQTQSQSNSKVLNTRSLVTSLLLDHIEQNCQSFNHEYSKIDSTTKSSDKYLTFFHWPGATYLTAQLFEGIRDLLNYYSSLIQGVKTEENLADQTSFLNLIKILSSNFKALSYCGIKLPEILDEENYNLFVKTYQSSIINIIENGFNKEGSDMVVCGSLWDELYASCQGIMTFSIQLLYSDANAVVSSLAEKLSDTDMSDKKAENCAFSLQFLTSSQNFNKFFQQDNKSALSDIKKIVQSLDRIQTTRLHSELANYKLFEVLPDQNQPSLFYQACDAFERNFYESLHSSLENINLELAKKIDRTPAGKLKRKADEETQEDLLQFIASIFAQLSNRWTSSFTILKEHLKNTLDPKEKKFFSKTTTEQFVQWCKSVHRTITAPWKSHLLNLYLTILSQMCGEKPQICSLVTNSAIKLAESLTQFSVYLKDKIKLLVVKGDEPEETADDSDVEQNEDDLKNEFTSNIKLMTRRICWMVGSIAYNLILIKNKAVDEPAKEEAKEETADQKMIRMLMESKVLSGGIEGRFLSTFAQDTKDKLKIILDIIQDQTSLEQLTSTQQQEDKEDILLNQVFKVGQNTLLDLLIDVLQNALEHPSSKAPHAKISSENGQGIQMCRAIFSVMLKYSQFTDILDQTIDEIDILDGQVEPSIIDKNERLNEIRKEIKDDENFQKLLHQWKQASQIRIWIQEKKTNLSEKIEHTLRATAIKQKKEKIQKAKEVAAKLKEAADKLTATETEKEEQKTEEKQIEFQIDTTSKPLKDDKAKQNGEASETGPSESKEEEKKDENDDEEDVKLTSDEESELQNQIFEQIQKDLSEIFTKIAAKAEYLLKMQVPVAYKFQEDQADIMIHMPSYLAEEQEKANASNSQEDWSIRLKRWKSIKGHEGQIKSDAKLKQEIFDNGLTSVLAVLYTPITVQKIQKRVETDFLKASRRAAGLHILSQIICLDLDKEVQIDISNWFTSSLRENKNQLTHYLAKIQSCGNHLESTIRNYFFKILNSILNNIRKSKDKKVIIRLLDAVNWKFMGRDHISLVDSDIFRLLREGDGSRDHLIKQAWGKRTGLKSWELDQEPTSLQYVLLETFENLFLNIVSRIVDSDLGLNMKLKAKGTAIPMLERSKSVISTSVSEKLVGESFHILFKELNRYVNCIKEFPGIDYQHFVNLFNKIQVSNLKNSETKKIGEEFVDELLFDVETEIEKHKKEKEAKKKLKEAEKEAAKAKEEEAAQAKEEDKAESKPIEETSEQTTETETKKEEESQVSVDEVKVEVETDLNEKTEENQEKAASEKEEEVKEEDEAEDAKKTEAQQKENEAFEMIQTKLKEFEEKQAKALHKLYDGGYLRRLLRMLEIFTSVAQTQAHALAMVQRVANPYMLQILVNLFAQAEPRNQVLVLKVIQNLLRIGIPSEIFEATLLAVKSQPDNESVFNVKSELNFTSNFLTFWFGNLNLIRSSMFSETKVISQGSYEVSQEISRMINTIQQFNSGHYVDWCNQIKSSLTQACLKLEQLTPVERDVVFCLLPGADFIRVSIGCLGKTEENQLLTVLGYREEPAEEKTKSTQLNPTFTSEKEKLVGLYFNKDSREQQEIVEVMPHAVQPILSFDEEISKKLADQSVLNNSDVLKHLISLLTAEKQSSDLQVQILKAVANMLQVLKSNFLELLKANDLLPTLIRYLFKTKLSKKQEGGKQVVVPITWLEARITNMRVNAQENCRSLLKSVEMKCQVLKNKQLIFTHIDSTSGSRIAQNAPLISSVNLHKVNDNTKYFVNFKPIEKDEKQVFKQNLSFINSENLQKLDQAVFLVMKQSEAIVTYDVSVRQLIVDISTKSKEYNEAENKEGKLDWSQVFNCVIFVVRKENFYQILQSPEKSFFEENGLNQPIKTGDAFEDFKQEMKIWAGVDIQKLMYHICLLPEKSISAIKSALPEILKKVEEEILEQKSVLQTLENEGSDSKIAAEKDRLKTVEEERNKKITEVLGLDPSAAFKEQEITSVIEKIIKQVNEQQNSVLSTECELFNILDCKKAHLDHISKLVETQFKEKVDVDSSVKLKSDQAKCKLYLKEITNFNVNDLQKSYNETFNQLLGEYASQTLLEILNSCDLKIIAPILLSDKVQRKQLSCFLKSSFNSAQLTFISTGQKIDLKLIKGLFRKLFTYCLNDESNEDYIHQFLIDDIMVPGVETLKKLQSEKSTAISKHFQSEEDAIEQLHPSLLHFIIQIVLEFRVKFVLQSKSYLPQLMGLALGMFVKFWVPTESTIPMKLLAVSQNIVFFVQEYLDVYMESDVISKIINTPILTFIIKEIDFTTDTFSEIQKLLLEVYLSLITLKDMAEAKSQKKIDSIIQMTPGISLAKRSLRIVKEKQEFKLLKYFIHQSTLQPHQSKSLNQYFGTQHPHLDVKIRAKYSISEVERIQFKANEKCELKPFTFVGISQTADGKDMELFTKEKFKEKEGLTKFNSAHFYVFYPVKKQIIIAMGEQKRSRMGEVSASDIPQIVKSSQSLNPIQISTSRNSTFILTEQGELYSTGEKYGSSHSEFTLMKLPQDKDKKDEIAEKIFCGRKCKFVIAKSGKTFYCGESNEFELPNNATSAAFKEFKLTTDEKNTEKIVDISCGIWYNLFVTDQGKLWASGKKFLKRVGLDSENIMNLNLPNTQDGPLFVLKAWTSQVKDEQMALVQVKNSSGEIQLWSVGKNDSGCLGLGDKTKETKVFTKLAYDSKTIQFTEVSLYDDHAIAIDQNGQLWAWGNNQQGRAGLGDDLENCFHPTKLASFEALNLKAIKVSCGRTHSLVLAKEQNGNNRLYSIGKDESNFKIFGCTKEQATESVIRKISHFADLDIHEFSAATSFSMIILKGEKNATDGLYDHKLSDENIVNGVLHAYQKDGKWEFMSQQDYQNTKGSTLPDICIAFKYPIQNMETVFNGAKPLINVDLQSLIQSDQEQSDFGSITSSISDVKIQDVLYTSSAKIGGDDIKVNLSESEILTQTSQYDLNPLIYFRLKKPLKAGARLPVFDLKTIYGQTNKFGFDFEVQPDFSYVENSKLIENTSEQFKEFCDLLNKFPAEGSKELQQQMNKQVATLEGEIEIKHIEKFNVKDMTFKEEKDGGKLFKVPNSVKEKQVNLIWHYNYFFVKLQRYLVSKANKGFKGQKIENSSAANIFNQVKHLILTSVKMNFVDNAIKNLSAGGQVGVTINRNDALRFEESGKVDHTGEKTIFGQIFQSLKGNYDCWKQNAPDDQALRVDLDGESAIDAGGPYRETLTNLVSEMENGVLPLFVKTANNKSNHGENRNCYQINIESVTPTHQQMFKFLGVLIGYAFRSKSCLPFNLPPLFWKTLCSEPCEEADLNSVDTYTYQTLTDLRKQAKKIKNQAEYEQIVDQTFTLTVNGKVIELCPQGKDRMVNQSNLQEYISLICQRKFQEDQQQIKWIKEGVNIIISSQIVGILSWNEVEDRVAGQKVVDVEKLKSITQYRSCDENTKVVKMFWNVMSRMSEEDKTLYLKFVWGRLRMPFDCSTLRYKHRIAYMDYWDKDRLPESHTCFFAIDIPNYENEEILEKKLLTSIRFCGEIDND